MVYAILNYSIPSVCEASKMQPEQRSLRVTRHHGSPYLWDNIVVTPNIKIVHAEAIYESWMNGHAIMVADLAIPM